MATHIWDLSIEQLKICIQHLSEDLQLLRDEEALIEGRLKAIRASRITFEKNLALHEKELLNREA